MSLWDQHKNLSTAVSGYGTDILNVTGATTGDWKALVILDGTTTITAFTDNGASPIKIPLDTAFSAGTFISANGAFTSVSLGVAGSVSLSRRG